MKRKSVFLCSIIGLLSCTSLVGCGGSPTITVWVGNESVEFYKEKATEFLAANPDFGYGISIVGTDSGTNGGAMVQDNTACGDIVTIAHDNIGKLSQLSLISPITNESLLAQIEADNPDSFKSVIQNYLGPQTEGAKKWTFAAPYISQALFLLYNKKYVTAEQAKTFEGLEAAATAKGEDTKAFTVMGTDGFNYSFTLLARKLPENTSSLRLYEGGEKTDCYVQSNEEVALQRWAQETFNRDHGGTFGSDSGWEVEVKNGTVLSLVAGSWKYNAFKASVGAENVGCAILPTFKLTSSCVEGIGASKNPYTGADEAAPVAGTEYRAGTFADCKVFVINMAADEAKYDKISQLIQYFSSKEVQNESFLKALNVPAYKGAEAYIETIKDQVEESAYMMAKSQVEMANYGIPQPFSTGTLNTYYYSKSAPDLLKEATINASHTYDTVDSIRTTLFKMEYIWMHGKLPNNMPDKLPADAKEKRD